MRRMDPDAVSVRRLAERSSGLIALCLGFAAGTVMLSHVGDLLTCRSPRYPVGRLAAAAELLDKDVLGSGLPRVVEDLSERVADGDAGHAISADEPSELRGSYAGVPVRSGGRTVGVVSVVDPRPQPVGRQQIEVLAEFARLLADQLQPTNGLSAGVDEATAEVAAALAAGELRPWYQPVIELASGRVIGVEALARWHRPGGAVEGPASFLPAAERTDLVLDVDRAVTVQALSDLAGWQQIRPDFRVGVNLSGRHLDGRQLVSWLDSAVMTAGVPAWSVDLEITETARPTDLDIGREVLKELGERGFTVWFDDFGSGWSALQDLIRLPVAGIKLDRTFAEQLGTPIDDAVVAALAAAADQVGLKVTIEGIQEPRQAARALELGCHFGQGYLWSRPCPAAAVKAMICD